MLVVGDARTNYLDPRRARLPRSPSGWARLYWLNPEPRRYWNQGDSVIGRLRAAVRAGQGVQHAAADRRLRPVAGRPLVSRLAGYYEAGLVREYDGLHPVAQVELGQQAADVGLDGGSLTNRAAAISAFDARAR